MNIKSGLSLVVTAAAVVGLSGCSSQHAGTMASEQTIQLAAADSVGMQRIGGRQFVRLGAGDAFGGEVYAYYLASLSRGNEALAEAATDLPDH